MQDIEELEVACQYKNIRQFSQSLDTPFLSGIMFKDVGILAEGPGTEASLNGNYHPKEDVDTNTRKFLKQLQRLPHVQEEREIGSSLKEHIKIRHKAREIMSCKPSGLYFGHFKTMCLDPVIATFDWQM